MSIDAIGVIELLNGLRVQLNRLDMTKMERCLKETEYDRNRLASEISDIVTTMEEVMWIGNEIIANRERTHEATYAKVELNGGELS